MEFVGTSGLKINKRLRRLAVRTQRSQRWNTGSTPVGATSSNSHFPMASPLRIHDSWKESGPKITGSTPVGGTR